MPILATHFDEKLAVLTDTRHQACRDARRAVRIPLQAALTTNGFSWLANAIIGEADSVRSVRLNAPPDAQALWWLMACACSSVQPAQIHEMTATRPTGDATEWNEATIAACKCALDAKILKKQTSQPPKQSKTHKAQAASQRAQENATQAVSTKALKRLQRADAARQVEASRLQAKTERLEREALAKLAAQTELLANLNSVCAQSPCALTAISFRRLQAQHKTLFDEVLTLPKCMKRHGLTKETRDRLDTETEVLVTHERIAREEQARLAALAKVKRDAERAWEKSLLHTSEAQVLLGITTTERDRWMTDQILEVAQYREFRKWGKTFDAPYFDPAHLKTFTPERIEQLRELHAKAVFQSRSVSAKKASVKTAKTRAIKKALNLHNYEAQFEPARDLGREWHLYLGPTNSGKTHAAMQALAEAKSGIYLAPLRLLALENYERLKAKGIPVNLLTGEERIFDRRAKHTCATVEMCDFTEVVDVAVIDEVQLLDDPQRGWAWAAALMGVPAQTVYACGAPHAHDALQQLAGICYETCTVREFERLAPLSVAQSGLTLDQVQAGDAVIAFSRHEVLQFASAIKARGLGVSVIYGALSPEVRRSQAQAFTEGRTQVVVATDAIGLGVNLPIKRVVFSAMTKYDGVSNRALTPLEIRQIAGRAGRYGLEEGGIVTGFSSGYMPLIAQGLSQPVAAVVGPYKVMPTWAHVATVLRELNTNDVGAAFEFFTKIKFGGQFMQADLTDCMARYAQLDGVTTPLSAKDRFMLCCAPADPQNDNDMELLVGAAYALSPDYVLPIPKAAFDLSAKEPNGYELREAEVYSRQLALFSWIACKWPDAVRDAGLADLRSMTAEFIDRALLAHQGEFVSKRRKRYGW